MVKRSAGMQNRAATVKERSARLVNRVGLHKSNLQTPVMLRDVRNSDLPTLFEHQHDPEASWMAVWPSRERHDFMAHWAKILANTTVIARAIMLGDQLAGNVVGFNRDGRRLLGY